MRKLSSGFNERLRKSPACWTCWRGSLTELHKLNSLVLLFLFFPPWVSPLPHCLHLELFQLVHCQQSMQQIIYLQYSWSWKQTQSDKSALLWRTNLANMTFVRTWKILKECFAQEHYFFFMQNLIRCMTRQSNIKQQWWAFVGQRTRDQGPLAVSCMAPNNNPTVLFLLPKIHRRR